MEVHNNKKVVSKRECQYDGHSMTILTFDDGTFGAKYQNNLYTAKTERKLIQTMAETMMHGCGNSYGKEGYKVPIGEYHVEDHSQPDHWDVLNDNDPAKPDIANVFMVKQYEIKVTLQANGKYYAESVQHPHHFNYTSDDPDTAVMEVRNLLTEGIDEHMGNLW